jgi:glucosylceramidase
MFYILGHFSKFIPPGSIRINSTITFSEKLEIIAFVTPSNQRVLVALNSHSTDSYILNIKEQKQEGSLEYQLSPQSIATFIWNK